MSSAELLNDMEKRRRLIIGVASIVSRFGWRSQKGNHAIRCEVATALLNRNVESFNDLSTDEIVIQWHAWYGAELVATALTERKAGTRV